MVLVLPAASREFTTLSESREDCGKNEQIERNPGIGLCLVSRLSISSVVDSMRLVSPAAMPELTTLSERREECGKYEQIERNPDSGL